MGMLKKRPKEEASSSSLQQEEEKFYYTFNFAAIGMALVGLDGKFLKVNKVLCETFGYSEEELLSKKLQDITYPPDFNLDRRQVRALLANHLSYYHIEKRYVHKDGQLVWGFLNVSLVKDRHNRPQYFIGQIININQRIMVENALRESEERFSHAFEYAAIGVALVSIEGTWLKVNRSICEITGYPERELLSKNYSEVIYSPDVESNATYLKQLLEGKITNYTLEQRYVRKSGELLWVLLSGSLVRDKLGNSLYYIFQIQNIDDRKKFEQALKDSEQRWHFAIEGSGDGLWDWDLITNKVFFSKKWKEMLGYTDDEIKNLFSEWSSRVHPDDLSQCYKNIETHFLGKSPIYIVEHRMKCKDGNYKWILARGKITNRDSKEKPVRMIGTHSDITERKMAEEKTKNNEAILRSIFNNRGVGIAVTNRKSKILFVNQLFCHMLDYTEDEVKKGDFQHFLSPSDFKDYQKMMQQLSIEREAAFSFEREFLKKTHGSFWGNLTISVSNEVLPDEEFFVHVLIDATKTKEKANIIEKQAFHDYLTGLPNRNLLLKALKTTIDLNIKNHRKLAVLFIDLDDFKDINDTEGHEAGDSFLKEVAVRLKQGIRQQDFLARLGGDEFIVVAHNFKTKEDIEYLVERIFVALQEPIIIGRNKIRISCSIGIAISPDHSTEPEKLITYADNAMYKVKQEKEMPYYFFEKQINEERVNAANLKMEIESALERNEFFLLFQPIVDLFADKIVNAEALVRWNHPKGTVLLPKDFLKIAEKSKQIVDIDNWVLQNAGQQLQAWRKKNLNILLSINMTAYQLENKVFLGLLDELSKEGVTQHLCIEVTEALFIRTTDRVLKTLAYLRNLGIKISIDDLGTGYSSLSYLKEFPVDFVKVDKSFVSPLAHLPRDFVFNNAFLKNRDVAFLQTIINLGHGLGAKIIAEGIETPLQEKALKLLGCDYGQGYYYGRPCHVEEFERSFAHLISAT